MDAVKIFNNELFTLNDYKPPISKAKMTQITKSAIKAIKFYKHVVQSVEKFVQRCKPEYKVPGLYVIDSIVRQSRHQFGQDKDLFAPRFCINIINTFQNLYRCAGEDKSKIVRVLNLWQKNNVFKSEIIQPLLDMASGIIPPVASVFPGSTSSVGSSSGRRSAQVVKHWVRSQEFQGTSPGSPLTPHGMMGTPVTPITQANVAQSLPDPWGTQMPNSDTLTAVAQILQSPQGQQLQQLVHTLQIQQQKPQPSLLQALDAGLVVQLQALTAQLTAAAAASNSLNPLEQTVSLSKRLMDTFDFVDDTENSEDTKRDAPSSQLPLVSETLNSSLFQQLAEHLQQQNLEHLRQQLLEQQPAQALAKENTESQENQEVAFGSENSGSPSQGSSQQQFPETDVKLEDTQEVEQEDMDLEEVTEHEVTEEEDVSEEVEEEKKPVESRTSTPSRSYSRSPRKRRSRSRSGSRKRKHRKRSRSRSREYDRDRKRKTSRSYSSERRIRARDIEIEKEKERQKKGLPPIRPKTISVCSTTLWVGQLDKKTTQQDLTNLFEESGQIEKLDMIAPRGCAYICMVHRQDAYRALEKLGSGSTKFMSKSIKIAWALNKGVKMAYKQFWDADLGVTYIPWEKVKLDDLKSFAEGGMIDQDTLNAEWETVKISEPVKVTTPPPASTAAAVITTEQTTPARKTTGIATLVETAYTQAGAAYTQPTAVYSQTVASYNQPVTSFDQQATAYDQPATAYDQPATAYDQQATAYDQPAAAYEQTAATYEQPAAAYARPTAAYARPTAAYARPTAAYARPTAAYARPTAAYAQPRAAYAQSAPAYTQPASAFAQSAVAFSQPASAYSQPTAAYSQPAVPYNQPVSLLQMPLAPTVPTVNLIPPVFPISMPLPPPGFVIPPASFIRPTFDPTQPPPGYVPPPVPPPAVVPPPSVPLPTITALSTSSAAPTVSSGTPYNLPPTSQTESDEKQPNVMDGHIISTESTSGSAVPAIVANNSAVQGGQPIVSTHSLSNLNISGGLQGNPFLEGQTGLPTQAIGPRFPFTQPGMLPQQNIPLPAIIGPSVPPPPQGPFPPGDFLNRSETFATPGHIIDNNPNAEKRLPQSSEGIQQEGDRDYRFPLVENRENINRVSVESNSNSGRFPIDLQESLGRQTQESGVMGRLPVTIQDNQRLVVDALEGLHRPPQQVPSAGEGLLRLGSDLLESFHRHGANTRQDLQKQGPNIRESLLRLPVEAYEGQQRPGTDLPVSLQRTDADAREFMQRMKASSRGAMLRQGTEFRDGLPRPGTGPREGLLGHGPDAREGLLRLGTLPREGLLGPGPDVHEGLLRLRTFPREGLLGDRPPQRDGQGRPIPELHKGHGRPDSDLKEGHDWPGSEIQGRPNWPGPNIQEGPEWPLSDVHQVSDAHTFSGLLVPDAEKGHDWPIPELHDAQRLAVGDVHEVHLQLGTHARESPVRPPLDLQKQFVRPLLDARQMFGRPPFDEREHFGRPPMDGREPFGRPLLEGREPFGRPPMDGREPFVRSPMDGRELFGRPPMDGREPFVRSPMDGREPFGRPPMDGREPFGRPPMDGREPFGRPPMDGREPFGRPPMDGREPFGRPPMDGREPFGRSPIEGREPFGRPPIEGRELLGRPPLDLREHFGRPPIEGRELFGRIPLEGREHVERLHLDLRDNHGRPLVDALGRREHLGFNTDKHWGHRDSDERQHPLFPGFIGPPGFHQDRERFHQGNFKLNNRIGPMWNRGLEQEVHKDLDDHRSIWEKQRDRGDRDVDFRKEMNGSRFGREKEQNTWFPPKPHIFEYLEGTATSPTTTTSTPTSSPEKVPQVNGEGTEVEGPPPPSVETKMDPELAEKLVSADEKSKEKCDTEADKKCQPVVESTETEGT